MQQFKILKTIFPLLLLTACIQTTTLKNGYEEVATNPKVYKNRKYFDKSILSQIDTTVIYEEYNTSFYIGDKPVHVLARYNYQNPRTTYGVYRFYGNGCYNLFVLDRDSTTLTKEMFDPNFTGGRGILYKSKNQIKGDLITQIGQMSWAIGKETDIFNFNGDTLFVSFRNLHSHMYIKRKISKDLLTHNADW